MMVYIYIMHVGKISHSNNMVSHRHALSDGVCTNKHTIYEHISNYYHIIFIHLLQKHRYIMIQYVSYYKINMPKQSTFSIQGLWKGRIFPNIQVGKHVCRSRSICSEGVGDLPYEDKWWTNVRVGANMLVLFCAERRSNEVCVLFVLLCSILSYFVLPLQW